MSFLVLSYIKILIKAKKILIIIQRSNGDVFLSSSLIKSLHECYANSQIDLLINEDTISVANLIPYVKNIHTFSYQKKKDHEWQQEKKIFTNLFDPNHIFEFH